MRRVSYREEIDDLLSPTRLLKTKSEYFYTEQTHKEFRTKLNLLLEAEAEVLKDPTIL